MLAVYTAPLTDIIEEAMLAYNAAHYTHMLIPYVGMLAGVSTLCT